MSLFIIFNTPPSVSLFIIFNSPASMSLSVTIVMKKMDYFKSKVHGDRLFLETMMLIMHAIRFQKEATVLR